MAEHNNLGKEGEEQATTYLVNHNYTIRHRNWRSGKKELDIIAEKEGQLIVVEVKTRRDEKFARPEDAVTPMKIRRTVAAADAYIRCYAIDLPVRFDILTLVGNKNRYTIEHIKDAFVSPIF
jgi:putative endonuclease